MSLERTWGRDSQLLRPLFPGLRRPLAAPSETAPGARGHGDAAPGAGRRGGRRRTAAGYEDEKKLGVRRNHTAVGSAYWASRSPRVLPSPHHGGPLPVALGLEASLCAPRVNPPLSFRLLSSLCLSVSLSLFVSLSLLSVSVSPSLCVSLLPGFSFLREHFPSSACCGWSSCVSFVPCWRLPSPELTHGRPQAPAFPLHRSSSSVCPGPPATPPPQSLGPIFTVCPRLAIVHVAGAVPSTETPSVTTGPAALGGIWSSSGRPSGRLDRCQLLGHQQEIVSFSEHLWKLTQHP